MFDINLPWWEFIVRAVIVYFALLLIVRMSGKRTIAQYTPFDLLVIVLLSESVSNSLSGGDDSLVGGLIIAVTLIALNMAIAFLSSRSPKIESAIEGSPILLGQNGHIFEKVLKSQRIGQSEVDNAMREADCSLEEMEFLILEANGNINVLKKKPPQE